MYKARTLIAIALVIVMIVGIIQACNNESDESNEEWMTIYSTEYMTTP